MWGPLRLFAVVATGALALPATTSVLLEREDAVAHKGTPHRRYRYNSNGDVIGSWGGAVQTKLPSSKDHFAGVFGQFVVPTVSMPTRPNSQVNYLMAAWVGMDGVTDQVVWQAGIQAVMSSSSASATPAYAAWWEWYPSPSKTIANFPVAPGDSISINITMVSPTSGTLVMINISQDHTYSLNVSVAPNYAINGSSVEWVIEAPEGGVPKLTPISWTNCRYHTALGFYQGQGLQNVATYDLEDGYAVQSNTTYSGGNANAMQISYIPLSNGQ